MDINFNAIQRLKDPHQAQFPSDHLQYLATLKVPIIIDITGKDSSRWRVVTTLLHGNEPSGFIALHKWLTQEKDSNAPQTNMRFIICSVEAAKMLPLFSHRYLNNGIDINRCFGTKFPRGYYQRANVIAEAIKEVAPELVIDLHNTSGTGPAFAVCTEISDGAKAIISLFCQHVIVSSIKLGALMEQNFNCPVITIECGGAKDIEAHNVAYQGIKRLAEIEKIKPMTKQQINVIRHPLRLKLRPGVHLSYASSNDESMGVILHSTIEQLNFNGAKKGQSLGWLDKLGLANFELFDEENHNVVHDYFHEDNGQLLCQQEMRIFMATSNRDIAMADCLFYLVKANS